ncbi:hypothetical protein EYR40_003263 [Pleurotus pulmonarius]|nr:hypothetical protein EYR40_003263 [Pleurotus pulmonarius]KAF4605992.1 hypothetical protein EYR38_000037 [Pleurotus pulmonarius]
MVRDLSDELSLRHLPDISDASFSMELPTGNFPDTLLLAERSDFIHAADITFGCLAEATPSRTSTLSQVTPKPFNNAPQNSHRHGHQQIDPIAPELVATVTQASITSPDIRLPSLLYEKPKQRQMKRKDDVVGHDSGEGGSGALRTFQKKLDRRAGLVKQGGESSNPSERNTNGAKKPFVRHNPGLSNSKEACDANPTALQSKPSNFQATFPTAKGKYSPIERITSQDDDTEQTTRADEYSNSLDKFATVAFDDSSFNPDISSISVAAPIAKRLLKYSQNYIPSPISPGKPTEQHQIVLDRPPEHTHDLSGSPATQALHGDDGPLTLSQLSPRKETQAIEPTAGAPPSPRTSLKRSLDTNTKAPQAKRPKLTSTCRRISLSVLGRARKPTKPDASAHKMVGVKPRRIASASAALPSGRGKVSNQVSSLSKKSQSQKEKAKKVLPRVNSSQRSLRDSEKENEGTPHDNTPHIVPSGVGGRNKAGPSASVPCNPTPPAVAGSSTVRSQYSDGHSKNSKSLNSVVESRPQSQSQSHREKWFHPVPDFKALHAMHESTFANRRGQITPVIPAPIQFQTDIRAKKREKFDEMVRAKEREKQLMEERMERERALEEEKEIMLMRRKAIPRAHEVPEWYKEAPKRKNGGAAVKDGT